MRYDITTTIRGMYARTLYSAVPKQDTTRPLNLEAMWVQKNVIFEIITADVRYAPPELTHSISPFYFVSGKVI